MDDHRTSKRSSTAQQNWSRGTETDEDCVQRLERMRERTLPQATLALREYSEMAIFSSTMWSAKLSGLQEEVVDQQGRTCRRKGGRTREPWLQQRPQSNGCLGSLEGTLRAGRVRRQRKGLERSGLLGGRSCKEPRRDQLTDLVRKGGKVVRDGVLSGIKPLVQEKSTGRARGRTLMTLRSFSEPLIERIDRR